MPTVSTSLEIAAPPAGVWEVFTDFARYPEWNPFFIRISGEQKEGAEIEATIKIPSDGSESSLPMRPIIHTLHPGKHLHWTGRLFQLPGLFTGNHHFVLHPSASGTRFENTEYFSGVLAWLAYWVGAGLYGETRRGFEMMNEALKGRVEGKGGMEVEEGLKRRGMMGREDGVGDT